MGRTPTARAVGDGGAAARGRHHGRDANALAHQPPFMVLLAGPGARPTPTLARTPSLNLTLTHPWPYLCSPEQARTFVRVDFPKDSSAVPTNIEFTIHRLNEFMMLMLGETILSITIAPSPFAKDGVEYSEDHYGRVEHYVTFTAGFIICLCMTFSFNVTEPHHSTEHVMRRDATAGFVWLMLFGFKALAVLQVGIGVKIALYYPLPSPLPTTPCTHPYPTIPCRWASASRSPSTRQPSRGRSRSSWRSGTSPASTRCASAWCCS